MNKRLLTAALGAALASFATTASARPSEGTRLASYAHRYNSYDDGSHFYQRFFDNNRAADSEERGSRRHARRGTHRHHASGTRHRARRVASYTRRERVSRYDRDTAWESRRERTAGRRIR
ncbi:MAG TPA: hypothetical protein VG963_31500, partial [Polyangiaceae bacterium]|nr:hypothetical protein [Polyangiaceae bacterium]